MPVPSPITSRRRRQRGFTIVELLTVITVIGVLVAAAAPSFRGLLRDRRVNDAAQNIADLYRRARIRAMGRGAATMVRWNASAALPTPANPGGHFTMKEAVEGNTSAFSPFLPSSSCTSTEWADGDSENLFVRSFEDRLGRYQPAQTTFRTPANAIATYAEVCFTPRGRTFIRFAGGGAWARMNGVPRVDVTNGDDGNTRAVVLPPTGAARIVRRVMP
jgi:prepilin-type N-terminal cleavage/methylation domain-containing protein